MKRLRSNTAVPGAVIGMTAELGDEPGVTTQPYANHNEDEPVIVFHGPSSNMGDRVGGRLSFTGQPFGDLVALVTAGICDE